MRPRFKPKIRRHMWVEFVVGSRPCPEGFSPGSPVFLPSQKPVLPNSNSISTSFPGSLSPPTPLPRARGERPWERGWFDLGFHGPTRPHSAPQASSFKHNQVSTKVTYFIYLFYYFMCNLKCYLISFQAQGKNKETFKASQIVFCVGL